jgi:hypothetical protein
MVPSGFDKKPRSWNLRPPSIPSYTLTTSVNWKVFAGNKTSSGEAGDFLADFTRFDDPTVPVGVLQGTGM